jgi:hypothetical protein
MREKESLPLTPDGFLAIIARWTGADRDPLLPVARLAAGYRKETVAQVKWYAQKGWFDHAMVYAYAVNIPTIEKLNLIRELSQTVTEVLRTRAEKKGPLEMRFKAKIIAQATKVYLDGST